MHEGNEDKPSSVRAILEQIKMFEQHVKPRELFYTFEKNQEHIPLWVQTCMSLGSLGRLESGNFVEPGPSQGPSQQQTRPGTFTEIGLSQ